VNLPDTYQSRNYDRDSRDGGTRENRAKGDQQDRENAEPRRIIGAEPHAAGIDRSAEEKRPRERYSQWRLADPVERKARTQTRTPVISRLKKRSPMTLSVIQRSIAPISR